MEDNENLVPTRVPNLDAVLGGGIPAYSLNLLAGPPGTGKTVLVQQMLFGHVCQNEGARVLYLTTLSEPTMKVLRYMQRFSFFDADAFGERVIYADLGRVLHEQPLSGVSKHILGLVDEHKPGLLVIDSFKAIRDLAPDVTEFRRFCYDLSMSLASARCTSFLVGEYDGSELADGAEFAVADGIFSMGVDRQEGQCSRFIQVLKLRGRDARMEPVPLIITGDGVRILGAGLTLRRREISVQTEEEGLTTGIPGLDALLDGGIPRGRSVILSGVSGTGKTTFGLQFLVHGAEQGEKGLLFSFEESPGRLRGMAADFGWDLAELEEKELLRIVYVPQTDLRVEEHLEQMVEEAEVFQPRRIVLDSSSVFLHRVKDPVQQREKTFQLVTLVQRVAAVGLLISDIPAAETDRISRFGVEETVVDGIIVLSSEMKGASRRRYLEVRKMRGISHILGPHRMEINERGIDVFYAGTPDLSGVEPPPPLVFGPMKGLIGPNLHYGSSWLVRGDPGVGKSTLSYQFAIEGLRRKEAVLFIPMDVPVSQVRHSMERFGFLPAPYLESGQLTIIDAFGGADLSPDDPEAFLFAVMRQVPLLAKPLRIVVDSLTPLALGVSSDDFVSLVQYKNRVLCRPDVVLYDTLLRRTLLENQVYSLVNAYDVVVDLYTPDWGEMSLSGNIGYRALQVSKARTTHVDLRPYPYVISSAEGIVVQKGYYEGQMEFGQENG